MSYKTIAENISKENETVEKMISEHQIETYNY